MAAMRPSSVCSLLENLFSASERCSVASSLRRGKRDWCACSEKMRRVIECSVPDMRFVVGTYLPGETNLGMRRFLEPTPSRGGTTPEGTAPTAFRRGGHALYKPAVSCMSCDARKVDLVVLGATYTKRRWSPRSRPLAAPGADSRPSLSLSLKRRDTHHAILCINPDQKRSCV